MLTREHAIARYKGSHILPDRLNRRDHPHYIDLAIEALKIYREGIGKQRITLHRQVQQLFAHEPDCPMRRIRSICKLLDDVSVYDRDSRGKSEKLRLKLFTEAAKYHPVVQQKELLFDHPVDSVRDELASTLNLPWEKIERELFADVMEFHRLKVFNGYDPPERLLSRYNIAQIQATLYRALQMTVTLYDHFKAVLRYAKFKGLLHRIRYLGEDTYQVRLDGPASILRNASRYGIQMAGFFPILTHAKRWEMKAEIRDDRFKRNHLLELSDRDRLKGYLPEEQEFDSVIEKQFQNKWGDRKRSGWELLRENEILHKDQHVFFPDFVFRHDSGQIVYFEIVGFWTPEYLVHKAAVLKRFQSRRIVIAVADSIKDPPPMTAIETITFKKSIPLKPILTYLKKQLD